jgi:hypothetical protein
MINELGNIFIMNASVVSVFCIMFTMLFVPMFWFFVLPADKARRMSVITLLLGTCMSTFVFFNGITFFGPFGGLLVLALWAIPAALVWRNRAYFVGLDQRYLVGLQVFRLIGALFIIEMFGGHVPVAFALAAGIGDCIVGVTAAILTLRHKVMPEWAVRLVLVIGCLDFMSALSFGVLSQQNPLQVFAVGFVNQVNFFPTGLIPLFLVPYAIVFHVLSFITLRASVRTTRPRI